MSFPAPFAIDPRFDIDSLLLAYINRCQVRVIDDARFAWMMLIPEFPGTVEWFDLPPAEAATVFALACHVGAAMKTRFAADKINIGALGNVVPQLHIHIVARRIGDAAWPGPVWGAGVREPMTETDKAARIVSCRKITDELLRA